MIDKLKSIKQFTLLSTNDMYKEFALVRKEVDKNEGEIKILVYHRGISIGFNTSISLANEFSLSHGFRLDFSRLFDTNKQRTLIWYKVKDCIPDYYELSSATITENHIKTCSKLNNCEGFTLQKEFKNGNCLYEPTEDLMLAIHLVNTITENMNGF